MSHLIKILNNQEVNRPQCCAITMQKDNLVQVTARSRRLISIRPTILASLKFNFELAEAPYFVHQDYARSIKIANFIAQRGLAASFFRWLIYLLFPFAVYYFLRISSLPEFADVARIPKLNEILVNCVVIALFGVIMWAKFKVPILIVKHKKAYKVIKIKNNLYADEWMRLNRANML